MKLDLLTWEPSVISLTLKYSNTVSQIQIQPHISRHTSVQFVSSRGSLSALQQWVTQRSLLFAIHQYLDEFEFLPSLQTATQEEFSHIETF